MAASLREHPRKEDISGCDISAPDYWRERLVCHWTEPVVSTSRANINVAVSHCLPREAGLPEASIEPGIVGRGSTLARASG